MRGFGERELQEEEMMREWWREQSWGSRVTWLAVLILWGGLWYYSEGMSGPERLAFVTWLGLR